MSYREPRVTLEVKFVNGDKRRYTDVTQTWSNSGTYFIKRVINSDEKETRYRITPHDVNRIFYIDQIHPQIAPNLPN